MTQVTGTLSGRVSKIEYSTNYSDYTDLSGGANSIEAEGGDRSSGEAWTFDGDTPVVTVGKLQPFEITVKSLYVASSVSHFAVIRGMQEAATQMNIRWMYDSAQTTGSWRFTSQTGFVIECKIPAAEAEPGDPLEFEWIVKAPSVTDAVVA